MRKSLIKRSSLLLSLLVLVAFLILSLPTRVEGFYSTGKLYSCMCYSKHYLRFHNGWVMHYATEHSPADLVGRYETNADGSVSVFSIPFEVDAPEEVLFNLVKPRRGFVRASYNDDKESSWLRRIPASTAMLDLVSSEEVRDITRPREDTIVVIYYDSEHRELRRESKTIRKRAEQSVPPKSDRAGG